MRILLALLPAAVLALTAYAVRPRAAVVAPARLTAVRATLVVGAFGIGSIEVLSALGRLTVSGVVVAWLIALAAALAAAAWRRRVPLLTLHEAKGPPPNRWSGLSRWERVAVCALGGLMLAELVLALVSPPNTYDSQTYHLPRIEHWVARESVEMFPTRIHRQVTYPPGAEFLLLHMRLLTGGDALYNLLQFGAAMLCVAAATRITAQLCGGRPAQLLTAFVLGTTPLFVLESTSTQTDLVMAAWAAALATLALDGFGASATAPRVATALLFGAAAGLIAVSKPNGLLLAAILLMWWAVGWLRRAPLAVAGTALAVIAGAAALAGPQIARVDTEFDHPLGPDYLRNSISLQRHDPGAVLVNGLRQAHTVFDTPVAPLRRSGAAAVEGIARTLGIDPDDPAITFDNATFPTVAWYPSEDKAAYPVQALLIVVATLAVLARPGRRMSGTRRSFAALLVLGAVLHAATVKWQPWGNRLILYLVVLATPLVGIWLAGLWRRWPSGRTALRAVAAATAILVALGGVAGWMSAIYGWPRRLVGSDSALVLSDWEARFVVRPEWADDYEGAGAAVRSAGAQRVGLLQRNDTWEYPWWLVLPDRTIVPLQSQLPRTPPDGGALDAIVCSMPPDDCRRFVGGWWQWHTVGVLSYALPS